MEQSLPFDVDALLIFGKVVECRSLSKAATLLGMPKSTVSRKLSKLESDLGIKLLRMNTHQLTVTDLGEKIYDHGVKILTEANGVRALVEGSKQEPQGELRVAMPVFVGIDYASRVGAAFLQRYPHSRLDIRLVDDTVHPVNDGFDVVFGTGPLQDSTLIARKVFSLELFLCASPDFVRQLAEPITAPAQLNALAVHRLRLRRRPTQAHGDQAEAALRAVAPRCAPAPTAFRCASSTSCRDSASARCRTRSSAPTSCATARIVPVLPEWSLERLDVHMIYPFQLSFSTLISAFYDTACEIIVENTART